jgi:5-methylcytosine-specific restriction endonuclease McrA
VDPPFRCEEIRPVGYQKLPPREVGAVCVVDGMAFTYTKVGPGRIRRFCSERCRELGTGRVVEGAICAATGCDKSFFPRKAGRDRNRGKYCSLKCRPQVTTIKVHPSRDEQRRAGRQRRWARRHVTEIERFRDEEIFERDGWQCKICFKPVDKLLKFPHRMAASLDHIIPVSKGGAHTRQNTQCSHWVCNSRKGDRGQDQLRLFGSI